MWKQKIYLRIILTHYFENKGTMVFFNLCCRYRAQPAMRDLLNKPCLVARLVKAGITVSVWSKYYTVLHKLWSSARKMKIEAKRLTITTSSSGVCNRGRDRPARYCSKLHITTPDMIDSFLPQKIASYWRITKAQTPTHHVWFSWEENCFNYNNLTQPPSYCWSANWNC